MIRYFEQPGERRTASVVAVGEAMLRLATPQGEPLSIAAQLRPHVAGAEANVAAALAQLGVPTRWIGALPEGPLGEHVARELARCGVMLDAVQWQPGGRLGLFFAEMGTGARPTRVVYDRAGSVVTYLRAIPGEQLEGARFLHVTGITPALGPDAAAVLADAVDTATRLRIRICIDVNYRALLWEPDAAREALAPLLAAADTIICGAGDAERVLGLGAGDPEQLAEALRAEYASDARHVVITRGEHGCVALDERGDVHRQDAVPTTVVDPFGMGDAFAAGVLWGLLDDDLPRGLEAGVTLAARKATMSGDLSRTTAAELEAALEAPASAEILR